MSDRGIPFIFEPSGRARRLTIRVNAQGEVIVTAPPRFPRFRIAEFVESARAWIEAQKQRQSTKPILLSATKVFFFGKEYDVKISNRGDGSVRVGKESVIVAPLEIQNLRRSVIELLETWLKARSIEYCTTRVYELSELMRLPFRGLAFKQQKTRWGSCSSQKNLNFNWKLIHAPKEVVDYVIIHELAHTRHMNHGRQFWDLVAKYDPDHPHHKRWLSKYGSTED